MKENRGFSLVELIIVIAIMAVLIGVLAPQYMKYVTNARIATDVANAEELARAFGVEIADGLITSGAYSGTSGTECTDLANIEAWPVIERKSGLSWYVEVDETGVKKIDIVDGATHDRIFPNPETSDGYYTKYHVK